MIERELSTGLQCLFLFYTYGLALAAVIIAFNKALDPEEYNSLCWKFVSYFRVYGINGILCIVVVAYLF